MRRVLTQCWAEIKMQAHTWRIAWGYYLRLMVLMLCLQFIGRFFVLVIVWVSPAYIGCKLLELLPYLQFVGRLVCLIFPTSWKSSYWESASWVIYECLSCKIMVEWWLCDISRRDERVTIPLFVFWDYDLTILLMYLEEWTILCRLSEAKKFWKYVGC